MIFLYIELFCIVFAHLLWQGAITLTPEEDDDYIEKGFLDICLRVYLATAVLVAAYYIWKEGGIVWMT